MTPAGRILGSGIYDCETDGHTWCEECGRYVHTVLRFRGEAYRFDCPECGAEGEGSL